MTKQFSQEQKEVRVKSGSEIYGINNSLKVGIALKTLDNMPIHAVRRKEENGTSGWCTWGGEYSDCKDFYQPLCTEHLVNYCPQIVKYLALAPGYRLIIDKAGYEEVWYDPEVNA